MVVGQHKIKPTLTKSKQVKQMFWAAFSGAPVKTGLIPLFGNPDAEKKSITGEVIRELYARILPTLLSHCEDAIFQHDNAPAHTAHAVRDLLNELNITVKTQTKITDAKFGGGW
jgi:hypothetical protein